MILSLDRLPRGRAALVREILPCGDMQLRLFDLGLSRGERVETLMISPLGDPKAYRICGAVIALRDRDARYVIVEETF